MALCHAFFCSYVYMCDCMKLKKAADYCRAKKESNVVSSPLTNTHNTLDLNVLFPESQAGYVYTYAWVPGYEIVMS